MGDEVFPFPGATTGNRFQRRAADEQDLDRAVSDLAQSRASRGTGDYRIRLDATRLAHQARSWDQLVSLVRRQLESHGVGGREDVKLLIDTATQAYGAEHGAEGETIWAYGLALQKEYDDKQADLRRHRIDVRARQLEADPILRANLEWQDRARNLAAETGIEREFVEEFLKEFDRLSMPSLPGVVDPRGLPLFQAEAQLAGIAYLLKQYLFQLMPGAAAAAVSSLIGGYEAATGKDILTGQELTKWERTFGLVAAVLPIGGRAVGVVKPLAGELSRGAKAIARLTREIGVGGRGMLRFLGKVGKLPSAKVQALLERLTASQRVSQSLRVSAEELGLARQVDEAFTDLAVVESGARRGSRTASGVIDDGRALSRSQSGTIGAKPPPASQAGPNVRAEIANSLSKGAQSLVDAGYLSQGIEALENLGVKVTINVAASLKALGATSRDFVNLFHKSKGFHRVVADFAKGGSKRIGAEFVMRFATNHPDILAKVKSNPLLIAFEWGVGIKKTRSFGDIFAREVDIVVRGDAAIGEADTIYHELKSWTERTLNASKGKKLPQQLVRDTALLDPHNIRWVFAAKIGDKGKIIQTFVELIQRDSYLTSVWGTDVALIEAALDRVVTIF